MGRVIIDKYACEYRDQSGWHSIGWRVRGQYGIKGDGAPNVENCERKRKALNQSFNPGGANFHVSKALGYVVHVNALRVRVNALGGAVLAQANAPMFEAV